MNKTPETRVIGGSRILLVRKYDGQQQQHHPPMSPPKRCLLEREIRFLDPEPAPEPPIIPELEEESLEELTNTSTNKKNSYGLIGGGIVVSALVGLWFYTQNNSGE